MSLKIELEFWSGEPHVLISFESGGTTREKWKVPARAMGLGSKTGPNSAEPVHLPQDVTVGIATLTRDCARTGPSEPLWLHLMRPYGELGVVGWEHLLGRVTQRPLLRLPDFLERSKEDPDILEIAVCYDPPWKSDIERDHKRVADVISSALGAPRAQILVHLFTTPEAACMLRRQPNPRLRIHDANTSKSSVENYASSSRSSSPWLDWMESSLQGRALDAVHFVCATEVADERANLLLRTSPTPERVTSLSTISASEVASFLQRTGAWAALFSPPPTSGTEAPCRYFADGLAQVRPGPVLFHEFSNHHLARGQLENVYRFLFASEPTAAPRLNRDFLYCQPALVRDYEGWDAERPSELGPARASYLKRTLVNLSQKTDLIPDFRLPEAPAWTSAAQRFVEQASLDSARFLKSAQGSFLTDSIRSSALSANSVVQDTLTEIQKIIDQHSSPKQGDN